MNPKVLALVSALRSGFAVASVEDAPQGGVRIRLRRGDQARALWFEHFEVPAVLQECNVVGLAK